MIKKIILERSSLALKRCEMDDMYPGWHTQPKGLQQMEVALGWLKTQESIRSINDTITKLEEKMKEQKSTHAQVVQDSTDIMNKRNFIEEERNISQKSHVSMQLREQTINSPMHQNSSTLTSDRLPTHMNRGTVSVLRTDVGLVHPTHISKNGSRVKGFFKASPWIKFYSEKIFNVNNAAVVRGKPKLIYCFPGFIHPSSNTKYELTSILGTEIRAVNINKNCDADNEILILQKQTANDLGLNWIINGDATNTAVENTTSEFGHPCMPSNSSRKRKYVINHYTPVPNAEEEEIQI